MEPLAQNAYDLVRQNRRLSIWLLSLTVLNAVLNTLSGSLTALTSAWLAQGCGGSVGTVVSWFISSFG
jgi:hypothetical protein